MKLKKGCPIWVENDKEYTIKQLLAKEGFKTYSRVGVWYLDVFTAVVAIVVTVIIVVLISLGN